MDIKYSFLILLAIIFSSSICDSIIKSPMIISDEYEFKIYEHPKCNMLKCSAIINEYYYVCREEIRVQSGKEKYGLTRDEAAAICMYTYYSKSITNILVQGNPGLYGCYMEHFINGFLKMWNYNRYHNVPKVEILYTGINMERSKNNGLIDGTKCLFKIGDIITFPSFGSTTIKYSTAVSFAQQFSRGGIVFNITTLKSKTKAVNVKPISTWQSEDEYLFLPGSKFKVITNCIRHLEYGNNMLYNIGLEEIEELENMKEYETQTIDENEDKLKDHTKECTQCNDNVQKYCKYCEDNNQCSECYAGYTPNESGICVKCQNNCLNCNSNDLNQCNKCFNGFGLIGNECKSCNDKNCIKCDDNINICQICKKGYALIEGKCAKKDNSFDSWCKTYQYRISSLKLWKKCIECIGPTYLEDNKCIRCKDEICSECKKNESGNEICSECMDGYGLVDGECIKCSSDCLNCNKNECLKGDNHFYLSDKICKPCNKTCLECQDDENKCTKCVLNKALKNNKCEDCDDCDYCSYENNNKVCYTCDIGKFKDNGKCIDCKEGCAECYNQNTCRVCYSSYYLNENKDCIKCGDNCNYCKIKNGIKECDFCEPFSFYFDSQGKCQKCKGEGCEECIYKNNKEVCTKCENSLDSLSGDKCERCSG